MRKLPSSGKRCTSSPSEVYGEILPPIAPYSTFLMPPLSRRIGEILWTYLILSTQLNSLCQRIPLNPLRSGSLDHQMKIGLPTT